jgi:hypothetical protein
MSFLGRETVRGRQPASEPRAMPEVFTGKPAMAGGLARGVEFRA